jgi:hypothetical protein
MKLTKQEAMDIIDCCDEDWQAIQFPQVESISDWSVNEYCIFRHLPSDKLYRLDWSRGLTDAQEEKPFDYTDPDPIEVHPVKKTIIVYEQVT